MVKYSKVQVTYQNLQRQKQTVNINELYIANSLREIKDLNDKILQYQEQIETSKELVKQLTKELESFGIIE